MSGTSGSDIPPVSVVHERGPAGLRRAAASVTADYTVVCSAGVTPQGDVWPWEMQQLFDFHPALSFIAGRIVSPAGTILGSGELWGHGGLSGCPEAGRSAQDPGPWALMLKPRCVDSVNGNWFAARTPALRSALANLSAIASEAGLGLWLGAWAATHDRLVATTPLLAAQARRYLDVTQSPDATEQAALRARLGAQATLSRWRSPWLSALPGKVYPWRAA